MINIVAKGNKLKKEDKVYVTKCWNCGCKFTYQENDVKAFCSTYDVEQYVTCPQCHRDKYIVFKKRFRGKIWKKMNYMN